MEKNSPSVDLKGKNNNDIDTSNTVKINDEKDLGERIEDIDNNDESQLREVGLTSTSHDDDDDKKVAGIDTNGDDNDDNVENERKPSASLDNDNNNMNDGKESFEDDNNDEEIQQQQRQQQFSTPRRDSGRDQNDGWADFVSARAHEVFEDTQKSFRNTMSNAISMFSPQQQQQQYNYNNTNNMIQRDDEENNTFSEHATGMRRRHTNNVNDTSQSQEQQLQEEESNYYHQSTSFFGDDFNDENYYGDELDDIIEKTHPFWKAYDELLIISLATQLGILFRIISSSLISVSPSTIFDKDSALFTNLPLNCLSCLIMGALCSGQEAWKVVSTRGSVPGYEEMREVQLEAMESRMKRSKSVLLFPGKVEESDVMQHYTNQTTIELTERNLNSTRSQHSGVTPRSTTSIGTSNSKANHESSNNNNNDNVAMNEDPEIAREIHDEYDVSPRNDALSPTSISSQPPPASTEEIIHGIAYGWDKNTSPQAMSSDLLIGLRIGFCGALSTFSSWNSSMVQLLRTGQIGDAIMGYLLGLALPIVSYKIGIHLAVYSFVSKFRRDKRREAKRGGYALRINSDDEDDSSEDDNSRANDDDSNDNNSSSSHISNSQESNNNNRGENNNPAEDEKSEKGDMDSPPSVRAVITAVFILFIVTQLTSIFIFTQPNEQQFAISLLFSPLGVFCRWRLSKWNTRYPNFPIGTFAANMLACSLSGSLGRILAGSPGKDERIILTSIIAGFAGSLSTLATFVVQTLNMVDVILGRLDGVVYAVVTLFVGAIVGLLMSQSVDWADEVL